jgi:hypothetical protein
MRSKIVLFGLGALALVATAAPAFAQKPSLGIAAGVSMPQGDFKDVAKMGVNGTLALGIGMPLLPVGLRFEGSYNRFPLSDDLQNLVGESGNFNFASASANVILGLPLSAIVVSPYLIAGGGMYWGNCSFQDCSAEHKFGYNAGVGIKLRALLASGYIEARYHSVSSDGGSTNFIPVTLGIMF